MVFKMYIMNNIIMTEKGNRKGNEQAFGILR